MVYSIEGLPTSMHSHYPPLQLSVVIRPTTVTSYLIPYYFIFRCSRFANRTSTVLKLNLYGEIDSFDFSEEKFSQNISFYLPQYRFF